ncbi:YaaC family protein [Oceanobacillus massiliensis]|uniref:YaaC family protein n=1 Tax=Oceanobacillus massiliensis TaxID=1465765 RepID=UPI000289C34B|nr:YaaC family protein [Oceanobacillus massiliensis]
MKANDFYMYINTQQTAQEYLFTCYREMADREAKSYQNSQTFMYYLDHGQKFYANGRGADDVVKPVLYFYGMTHLLKAYLLTVRPDYPESTSMLAHGVTVRKRKKKQYTFMDDEVKLQRQGLFPYFSEHLYSLKNISYEKLRMDVLFSTLPEMEDFYSLEKKAKMIVVGTSDSSLLKFPLSLLDSYHLTDKAFIHRVEGYLPAIKQVDMDNDSISIRLERSLDSSHSPFVTHMYNKKVYFPLHRDHFLPFPEVMSHYLILFNLSMLCRYEAEWWGDLLLSRPDRDFPYISRFLEVTSEKIPELIGEELLRKYGK